LVSLLSNFLPHSGANYGPGAWTRACGRFSGDGATRHRARQTRISEAACAGIFHSYQQLLRIATQPPTQQPHDIDIQGGFAPKHSLRDGFTAYFALSSETRLCCLRRSQIIACELDTNLGVPGPRVYILASGETR
jgi:hypothetical protein